jgi:Protein of unknown function (DUF3592)
VAQFGIKSPWQLDLFSFRNTQTTSVYASAYLSYRLPIRSLESVEEYPNGQSQHRLAYGEGTVTTAERAKVMFRKQPRITYSYTVNGAPFTGNRISFAGGYPPGQTDAILSRYPVGQQVVVFHAPDSPAEATLETGSNHQVTAQLRILLIFFVLIILLNVLNFYLKRLNEQARPPIRTYGAVEIVDPTWRA